MSQTPSGYVCDSCGLPAVGSGGVTDAVFVSALRAGVPLRLHLCLDRTDGDGNPVVGCATTVLFSGQLTSWAQGKHEDVADYPALAAPADDAPAK